LTRVPAAEVFGYEQNAATARSAWSGPRVRVFVLPFFPEWAPPGPWDLLLADFNTLTVKRRAELDEAVAAARPGYLVFTDVACVKLHLNFRSYGLGSPDLGEYWAAFAVPGYAHVAHSRSHHAASSALYKRLEG
jgi:hypothetical protein